MRHIGMTEVVLCAVMLAPAAMADVFVIEPTTGGSCTSLSGIWDSDTSTCSITGLQIGDGDELIVENLATVEAGGPVVTLSGILRLLPGSTFDNSIWVQPGGLLENGTSVSTGSLRLDPGATAINSGTITLNQALSGGLQTEGFVVNTGTITVLANATFSFNLGVMTNTGLIHIGSWGLYNFATIFNCGGTITGNIDGDPPLSDTDADVDGVCDAADCAPGDGGAWTWPRAVLDLALGKVAGSAELYWSSSIPDGTGGVAYDVISSTDPADFQTAVVCVETDEIGTGAIDPTPAPIGGLTAYLVRAENVCGSVLAEAPVPRSVLPCP